MNNNNLHLFQVVEIEINTHCNRSCRYCTNAVVPPLNPPRYMSNNVFNRIIDELAGTGFKGKISYHLYSEPLLRKDLEALVKIVKERLPEAFQLLFTNGDYLTDRRYVSLREAGINHFLITRHDRGKIPVRPDQTIQYPQDMILSNWGGILHALPEALEEPCFAPSDRLIVTVNGDVLLCCCDGRRLNIMGNIMTRSLTDIWFSKKFVKIRNLLREGRRSEASSICKHCDEREYSSLGKDYYKKLQD